MKKVFAVLAASALFLTGCGEAAATNLGAVDFQKKTQEAGVVILDVRTPAEFAAGHLEGAININAEDATFAADIEKLDKNAEYAVYCQSGRRSGNAVSAMKDAGFTKLTNLSSGIQDWYNSGLPIVTE